MTPQFLPSQGPKPSACDFVDLELRQNRGWPWPEDSWGLTPMYGEDGWCRSCGVPTRPQSGSLILQRKGFGSVKGAWVPNWQFDAYCLARSLAERIAAAGFALPLIPIEWQGPSPGDAVQIVAPTTGDAWFDPTSSERGRSQSMAGRVHAATSAVSGAGIPCFRRRCRRTVTGR